jgi:RNA polymerase sigma-70 factor (ECF subfamily)
VTDFREAIAAHRADLLRHCYRMLGSFADAEDVVQDVLLRAWKARDSYQGDAPVGHWLMRIATNTCLNELARQRRRGWPQLDREPGGASDRPEEIERLEIADWLSPAPDCQLFSPSEPLEARESVALAFLALLQRLPPQQRAVLLLKDVVGWSSEEIASALDLSVAAVSSALHRARKVVEMPARARVEPTQKTLERYVRTWEARDMDALVALLRADVVFAMPPYALWFRDAESFAKLLRSAWFAQRWSTGLCIVPTRANGQVALAFYMGDEGGFRRHSIQLVTMDGDQVAEAIQFIGAEYFRGFDVPERVVR